MDATLTTIREVYEDAKGAWTGWDWPHSFGGIADDCDACQNLSTCGSQIVIDGPLTDEDKPGVESCEHYRSAYNQAVEYQEAVESSAAGAEEEGRLAMEAAERGDYQQALRHAERACSIESEYGDCPTWRYLRQAIEVVA